jgi:hypothetical protein
VKKGIQIDIMRLSLIWIETNLSLLGDPMPPNVPMSFLGYRDSYAVAFDSARQKKMVPFDLKSPWDKSGQHFWEYYLEHKPRLEDVPGIKAWKFLVPFRGGVAVKKVMIQSLAEEMQGFDLESFFYPFGFGLILTFTVRKNQNLADAVKGAVEIRKDGRLNVEWASGTQENLYLNQFAEKCLTNIRQAALGQAAISGSIPVEPFTVFTVLKGAGKNLDVPPIDGKEIHRSLEAVTTWPPLWKTAKLPDLDDKTKLPLKSSSNNGDVVYARKRGRAIWFPALFTDDTKVRSSLACYHRNLVFASLQTESLCSFVTTTAQEIKSGNYASLRVMHRDCARLAAGILGRMYGGDRETYRSMSPKYHIQQNEHEAEINVVRDKFTMPPLA